MILKITPKQLDKVHTLVRDLCANCDEDGNCILLDVTTSFDFFMRLANLHEEIKRGFSL